MSEDIYIALGDGGEPTLRDASAPAKAPEPAKPAEKPAPAQGADIQRRRDAVVDAARTLDDLSPDGVKEFVTRRWQGRRVLEQADIESFAKDARTQRVNDVIDALDYRVRHGVLGRTKTAHVSFPRGMVRRTLRDLTPDEGALVVRRLRERGWSEGELKRHLKTFSAEIKSATAVGAAEEDWDNEIVIPIETPSEKNAMAQEDLVAFAERLVSSMPAPQVSVPAPKVTVEVKKAEPERRIVRDERGRIVGIENVPSSTDSSDNSVTVDLQPGRMTKRIVRDENDRIIGVENV